MTWFLYRKTFKKKNKLISAPSHKKETIRKQSKSLATFHGSEIKPHLEEQIYEVLHHPNDVFSSGHVP